MRRLLFSYCIGVALAALIADANTALAQSEDINIPPAKAPQSQHDRHHTTAEEILRTLRRIRPQGELIRSERMLQRGEMAAENKLHPEGTHFVGQIGQVRQQSDWWHFEFEDDGKPMSMKMLPNATLEAVVRSARGQEQSVSFVISGELTVYHGENFLFPRIATRSVTTSTSPPAPTTAAASTLSGTGTPASADDVLAKMREQQPSEQILPRQATPTQRPFNKPPRTAYLLDGAPLIRRPGRLVPRGDWLTFVFESDTTDYPELPLKLLPNQTVELMQRATQQDAEGVVFIVSGEITAFMGENFLLPRVALRRVDVGNITK